MPTRASTLRQDRSHTRCSIVPPDLLARVAREGSAEQRDAALAALAASASMRSQRSFVNRIRRELGTEAAIRFAGLDTSPTRRQTVYDNKNKGRFNLPGTRARGEGDPRARESKKPALQAGISNSGGRI